MPCLNIKAQECRYEAKLGWIFLLTVKDILPHFSLHLSE